MVSSLNHNPSQTFKYKLMFKELNNLHSSKENYLLATYDTSFVHESFNCSYSLAMLAYLQTRPPTFNLSNKSDRPLLTL